MTAADVRDEIAALLESLIGGGVVGVTTSGRTFETPDAPARVTVRLATGAVVTVDVVTAVRAATVTP